MKQLPIFEPEIISRYDTGIYAISLVEYPAIEEHFVAMSKVSERYDVALATVGDKVKRLVCGALLIPDQLIYRNDEYLGEYYIKYTAPIIEKLAENFMRNGWYLTSTTHEHQVTLYDNVVRELWTVTDPKNDKANALLGQEYPAGTLMCLMKINDADYYDEQIVTGKVKGFSIEAYFRYQLAENQTIETKQQKTMQQAKTTAKSWVQKVTEMLNLKHSTTEDVTKLETPAGKDATDSAKAVLLFDLQDGSELLVDADGNATINGEQAPAGQHQLADGNYIEVDDAGAFVLTAPETTSTTDPATAQMSEQEKLEAKQRAKQVVETMQKAKNSKKDAEIQALQARIEALERSPSADEAKANAETNYSAEQKAPTRLSRITEGLKARQAMYKKA